jgi:formamidopyrimidine-DNA glycosylase
MPELPEVEAARKLVAKHCVGKIIASAIVEQDESESWREGEEV